MVSARWGAAVLLSALVLCGSGFAQEQKNELSGLVGRVFVSDQGVKGISTFDTNLRFGKGLSFEVNYARHLLGGNGRVMALTFEVPAVFDPDQDLHFSANVIPGGYKAFFVTPSVRANVFASNAVSPWVSFGGGFGHFSESSQLEFGGAPNPGQTGTTVGVIQAGFGLDVRLTSSFSLRGGVRDFYSGVPQLNVDTGKSRQHNFFVAGGIVWRF